MTLPNRRRSHGSRGASNTALKRVAASRSLAAAASARINRRRPNGSKTLAQIEEEIEIRKERAPHESTDMARAFYNLPPKRRSQVADV